MAALVPLAGSQQPLHPHATLERDTSGNERITVTVKFKSKMEATAPKDKLWDDRISHDDFEAKYGADPAAMTRLINHASLHHLFTVESDPCKRRVVLVGKVSDFETAFKVKLQQYSHPDGTFRTHTDDIHVPDDVSDQIEAILGLGNRPVAKPHFQIKKPGKNLLSISGHAKARPVPMTAATVGKLYNFPTNLDGSGHCIALIELGGGYKPADMQRYFKLVQESTPVIVDVSVNGSRNVTGSDADGEVELDIQVAGTIAPKARIAVYFSDNSSQGFITAITNAAHDSVNKPDVISISWGGPESTWSWTDMTAMNNAIRDATLLGVTVLVASGDEGSNDGIMDGQAHADFPASSPYSLACGGTCLVGNGTTIASETVWNDAPDSAGGGGISHHYPVPDYQQALHIQTSANHPTYSGRGLPDVAGNADPDSGYEVIVDGNGQAVGGTSAVAPLYAGLLVLIVQSKGKRLGFINPALYTTAHGAFRKLTANGNNGLYSGKTTDTWNPCCGLGSLDGSKLLSLL